MARVGAETSRWVFFPTKLLILNWTVCNLCYSERKKKEEDSNSYSLLGSNILDEKQYRHSAQNRNNTKNSKPLEVMMECIQFNCQYLKYIFLKIALARSPLSANPTSQSPIKNHPLIKKPSHCPQIIQMRAISPLLPPHLETPAPPSPVLLNSASPTLPGMLLK